MRALHIVWPGRTESQVTPIQLWLPAAALVAIGLMSGYVHLLNEAVSRAAQSRIEQQQGVTAKQGAKSRRGAATLAVSRVSALP